MASHSVVTQTVSGTAGSTSASRRRPGAMNLSTVRRAVFFDRDGVLNDIVLRGQQRGVGSPRDLAELSIVPEAAQAIARLRNCGFHVFVVTNQPELARGTLREDALKEINAAIAAALQIDDWRICPHDDQHQCSCRKPAPGMVLDLAAQWDIVLSSSYFIGDTWKDVATGAAAGCRTVLIRRYYSGDGPPPDHSVETLREAVDLILSEHGEPSAT